MSDGLMCECCQKQEATSWMEWGEWLCPRCASQAIEDDADPHDSVQRRRPLIGRQQ